VGNQVRDEFRRRDEPDLGRSGRRQITIVWADRAYAGKLVTWAKQHLNLTIKTVSRPKDTSGFVVLPRRWVVERTLAWMMHARRHARDYERLVQHSETLITWAAITLMSRRLTRGKKSLGRLPVTPSGIAQAA
jgi:transposase